jgi:cell division control protein 6
MSRIIKDVGKLDPHYVPEALPHRGEELRQLSEIYTTVLETRRPQHAVITGKGGTGKTTLARRFFSELMESGKKKGVLVDLSFVNCKGGYTANEVMRDILSTLAVQPGAKQPINAMARMLKEHVAQRNSLLFVVLDEAHIPLKRDNGRADQMIYCLGRINEALKGPQVTLSLCLISNTDVLSLMEGSTKGIFAGQNIVKLEMYSWPALKDILLQRVKLAFHPGVASEECLDLIADIASGSGDARMAIEMLFKAGMAAESQGTEQVQPEHIRAAKANIRPHVTDAILENLEDHERLLLLGTARILKKSAYVTLREALAAYVRECEADGLTPRGRTQVKKYLKTLEKEGLVDIKRDGNGRTARTLVAIEDVTAEALVERLERFQQLILLH